MTAGRAPAPGSSRAAFEHVAHLTTFMGMLLTLAGVLLDRDR